MEKKAKAIELCMKYKQERIVTELQKDENAELVEQILNINFEQIEECKAKIREEEQYKQEKIENISYIDGNKLSNEEKQYYEEIGKKIIEKGSYAVVTMAGGQRNKAWPFRTKRNFFNECKATSEIFI